MRLGLKKARAERGLTQQELVCALKARAPHIKLVRATISKYEHGVYDIPGRTLELLAQVLDTPMDILYTTTPGLGRQPPRI
jgi:transcriptional regulator with XRE-family HTH domain